MYSGGVTKPQLQLMYFWVFVIILIMIIIYMTKINASMQHLLSLVVLNIVGFELKFD